VEGPSLHGAIYFDGTSAMARAVSLQLRGDALELNGAGTTRSVPVAGLHWPERTRHGMRVLHLPDGGAVQCDDARAWDHWCDANGVRERPVARWIRSWRRVLLGLVLLVAGAFALQRWGIPVLAGAIVAATPERVERAIGGSVLDAIDDRWMQASQTPPERQAQLRASWSRVLQAQPKGSVPSNQLLFRRSRIGANALALPGGVLIVTDDLVTLFAQDPEVLMGVLAHELGHVRHRHGLRMVVQTAVLGSLSALLFSDFSTVFATAPVLLGQASYSRDAERQADQEAVLILRAAGISPAVMVRFFARIEGHAPDAEQARRGSDPSSGSVLGSHPADAERARFFAQAARSP
jgi:Zn-dependent protease with chaperone function